jgi:deazaflavin-dependent oxidoreductase (nitroreductase family)
MYEHIRAPALHRAVRRAAASPPLAWLSIRFLHHIDRATFRLTRRRSMFSAWVSGLPVVMLTTRGRRTGRTRTLPVLALPDGDRLIVIASNFGQPRHPAWYHNLRAHPRAVVAVGGVSDEYEAHELTGEERDRYFRYGVEANPGWIQYRRRAAGRHIPVIRLERSTVERER